MSKPSWRLESCDEMRVAVGECHAYIDRVSSKPKMTDDYHLANLTFIGTGVVSTVHELSATDLRILAGMLTEFANLLQEPTP